MHLLISLWLLRRVWSEFFDFQLRFQRWQASHQALLAGAVSAAAPEVAAFRNATGEALTAGLALLRERRLMSLLPVGEVRRHDRFQDLQ